MWKSPAAFFGIGKVNVMYYDPLLVIFMFAHTACICIIC